MKHPTSPCLLGLTLALGAPLAPACDDEPASRSLPPRESCRLAAVFSDYRSTAVSLLTATGEPCAPDLVTSGSRPPGLLTALSGDVVLPSEPAPDGALYLIDRYPNAVITAVDPATSAVTAQLAVSPDYPGNPQDLAFVAGTPVAALLERPAERPAATPATDLILLAGLALPAPDSPARIDLSAYADPGLDPMPTRFSRATGRLWLGLTHLAPDFSAAGPGRALGLDPTTLAVTHTLDLAPLQNCGTLVASATTPSPDAEPGLWIVCSGLFRNSPTGPQRAYSGLAFLAPPLPPASPTPLSPTWSLPAADLHAPSHEGRPLGFTLAALDDDRALVVALGDLATALPDRLLLVTRSTSEISVVAEGGAFELGAVLPLPSERLILLADADPRAPKIRRFTWPDGGADPRELDPIVASDTGLPPRHLAIFR